MITTTGWIVLGSFLCALAVVGALGFAVENRRRKRGNLERLLTADAARAHAVITYHNEVHDSHSG